MVTPEVELAAGEVVTAIREAESKLAGYLLIVRAECTNDERIKLLSVVASKLAGMLDAIEVATRPEPESPT